jgi:hypothetical protein
MHVSRIVPACPAALIVIWLTAARESRLETNRSKHERYMRPRMTSWREVNHHTLDRPRALA